MAIELLQTPVGLSPSGNPVMFRIRTSQYVSGYYMTVVLYIGVEVFPEMFLYPDSDGVAEIDLSRILYDQMTLPLPDLDVASPQQIVDNLLQYRMVFTGHYDGITERLSTDTYTVIRAKMDERILKHIQLSDFLSLGFGYLSAAPDRRETTPDGVHYLCFLSQSVNQVCQIKAIARTKSGKKREYTLGIFGPTGMFTTWYIPVGLRHISFLNDRKDLESYTVWLVDANNNVVGKPIEFTLVRPGSRTKNLLFENSLGGWDSLPITEQKDTLKVERSDYNFANSIASLVSEFANMVECSSGYVSRRMAEMYKELLISERVYISGSEFFPIVIEKGTFTIVDETADLYSVSLKYKPARVNGLIREYATPVLLPGNALLTDQHNHQIATSDADINVNKNIKL